MLWKNPTTLEDLALRAKNTMVELLGIKFTKIGDDYLEAEMPVDHRTKQPAGILHGGASAAFAETLGSFASAFCVDSSKYLTVGLEINANHLKAVKDGSVIGRVTALHVGRRTHVWDIQIREKATQKLTCTSRLTVMVIEKGSI